MNTHLRLLVLLVGTMLACGAKPPVREQQPPVVAEQEPEGSHSRAFQPPDGGGFLNLVSGENLDGWTIMGDPAGWSVKDGIIRSEGLEGGDWLRFNEPQSDFILKLDWRVSQDGNSGVYIRAAEEGRPWESGYEIQISRAMTCTAPARFTDTLPWIPVRMSPPIPGTRLRFMPWALG